MAYIIEIEAYPFIPAEVMLDWITAITSGQNIPNYFEVDYGSEGAPDPYSDMHNFQYWSHYNGIGFALLYSFSTAGYDDYNDWYRPVTDQCYYYSGLPAQLDITADLYHVSAFYHAPRTTANEDQPYSFMYTAKWMLGWGCYR